LDFSFVYMARKLRHKPKTFMRSLRLNYVIQKVQSYHQKRSLNLFCSLDTVQYSTHILSSRNPNASILFLVGKLRQFPITFMKTIYSNSNVSNDVLFRQEDKNCHQVKMWSPTQQLVIKSIVPNFGL
jgi:hypothetical protein